MDMVRVDSWPQGANNVAQPNRLPEGAVRDAVNMDSGADGIFNLRAGFDLVAEGAGLRGAFGVGQYVVFVDGLALRAFNTATAETRDLATLASYAPITGAVLNGQLYLSAATESLRTDGEQVHAWGLAAPGFQVEVIAGGLPAGVYKVATTVLGSGGEESGASVVIMRLPGSSAIRVTTDDPRPLRIYVSPADAASLYYQGLLIGGAQAITLIRDDTEQLTTGDLVPMPACTALAAYHGVLVGCSDQYLFRTDPMYPHLMHSVDGFLQYSQQISMVAVTDGGVFVAADRTYFVTGIDTNAPSQRVVLDHGAISGSVVPLPDGSVAWFTQYGQAVGQVDGSVTLLNKGRYAPDTASSGAAGLLDHGGNQMLVTTMRGIANPNNIAAGDFAYLET